MQMMILRAPCIPTSDHVPVFARTPGSLLVDVFIRITDISGKIIGFSNSIAGCIRPIIDRSIIKFSVLLVIARRGQTRQSRVVGLSQSEDSSKQLEQIKSWCFGFCLFKISIGQI